MKNKVYKKNKGFTVLELLISIFVISIGIISSYSVVQQVFSYTFRSNNRLTAAYLGKEGIEIVRNIRDTNWLEGDISGEKDWDAGLHDGSTASYQADYETLTFLATQKNDCSGSSCEAYTGEFLKFDGDYYNYSLGSDTKYKRRIEITPHGLDPNNPDKLKVLVEVMWMEKGISQNIIIREDLYDWK